MSLDYLILEKKAGYGRLGWASFYGHESRLDTLIACLSGNYVPKPGELQLHSTEKDTNIIIQGRNTVNTLQVLIANKNSIVKQGTTEAGNKPLLLVDTTDGTVNITDFVKTELFGGGSGRGAGTTQTMYQEAGQCIVCSAKILNPSLENVGDIEEIGNQVQLGSGLEESVVLNKTKELCKTAAWNTSMINTADLLIKKGFSNAKFHYGTKAFPEVVENTVLEAFKRCKVPGTFGKDKWNPADIWITQAGYEKYLQRIASIPNGSSIQDLNTIMREAFSDGKKLVGVSLKKASTRYPTCTEHNTGDTKSTVNVRVVAINCDPDPRKQSGMNVKVEYEEDGEKYVDTLVFRKSSKSAMRVEKKEDSRKNADALHGNMGLEPLLHYIDHYNLNRIEDSVEDFKKQCVEESCQQLRDDCIVTCSVSADNVVLESEQRGGKPKVNVTDIFRENKVSHTLADLYKKYFNISEDKLVDIILDESATEVAVKYTCLYILNILGVSSLTDVTNENLNGLVMDCYRYASSETPVSSPFIKIS